MILFGALVFGFTSLAVSVTRFVRRLLNASSAPSPPGRIHSTRSLGIVAFSLFVGVFQGVIWERFEYPEAPHPVGWIVSVLLSFHFLSLFGYFLSKAGAFKRPLSDHLLRLAVLIMILLAEGAVAGAALADRADLVVVLWAVTFLLCGVLPSLILLPWLLRPFKIRQILSPSTPMALRAVLIFFSFTAMAPFGALAVPLWVTARQRMWPRLERGESIKVRRTGAGFAAQS